MWKRYPRQDLLRSLQHRTCPDTSLRPFSSIARPGRRTSVLSSSQVNDCARKAFRNNVSSEIERGRGCGLATIASAHPSTASTTSTVVEIPLDGRTHKLSALLLRDLCSCPSCVDPSTKQKEFSTSDIPADVSARELDIDSGKVSIRWHNDVPGFGPEHHTTLSLGLLRNLVGSGSYRGRRPSAPRTYWSAQEFEQLEDFDFKSYMTDDSVLLRALQQLHTHGLMFLSNLPESEQSVVDAGERIGPLKTTFYGTTWEVRSVPNATNVAYTSSNLGFHMDLMYMVQPPHLQLLHCMRSSSAGGASLFTDSFRALQQLSRDDQSAFDDLSDLPVDFHYDHPGSQYYHRSRKVIEQEPLQLGRSWVRDFRSAQQSLKEGQAGSAQPLANLSPMDFVQAVSWSPPFQAPFSHLHQAEFPPSSANGSDATAECLNTSTVRWHAAAQKFDKLIHDKSGIYERMMQPGQCVIFDNRRVLHARTAFDVDDAGKERWLRGAYVDKDPYISRLTVLEDSANTQL